MSSFVNLALVALLSSTAFALSPRQAGGPFFNASSTASTDLSTVNTPTSTLTSVVSTGTPGPSAPAAIGNWNLLGCANSPAGFLGWVEVANTPVMTEEFCTVSCTNYRYAGANGASCYCGTELEDVSTTTFPNSCDIPCPGNPAQTCGGVVGNFTLPAASSAVAKRQVSLQALLLTTYINVAYNPAPPVNITIGDIIINIDIIVFVDVCDDCDGGLTTITTTQTCSAVATCGCSTEVLPTIPLTTVARPCSSCGPSGESSTITVTLPVAAVTTVVATVPGGGAAVGTGAVVGTGAAGTGAVGGGVTAAAVPTTVATSASTPAVFTGEAGREMGSFMGAAAAGFLALLL